MQENTSRPDPALEQDHPSLYADLRQLASEAKIYAKAEIELQKSRAAYAGSELKLIAIFAVTAVILLFFAVMAAVVGTLIALGPVLGLWGAMATVTGLLLFLTATALWSVRSRIRRMKRILASSDAT